MFGSNEEGSGMAELTGGKLSGWKFLSGRGGLKRATTTSLHRW
jgi:hypothetical protein